MSRSADHHVIVLDNEAAQALQSTRHPKHARVVAHVQRTVDRRPQVAESVIVVPTSVRVEAGWDRTDASWAFANGLKILDADLNVELANSASAIRRRVGLQVSVVDAHVGAVIQSAVADRVTVITSDPTDIAAVAEGTSVVIVSI